MATLSHFLVLAFWLTTPAIYCSAQRSIDLANEYKIETYTVKEGLSSNEVMTTFQDSYGFIWIGTMNGLCKYDGYKFTTFIPDPDDTTTISGVEITGIYEDKKRNIWVTTWSSGLNKYIRSNGKFQRFTHNPNDIKSISSNSYIGSKCIAEDKYGQFWIATDDGVQIYHSKSNKFEHITIGNNSKKERSTRCIHIDKENNLWLGTDWMGLFKYNYTKKIFESFESIYNKKLSHETPHFLHEDNANNLWIMHAHYGVDKMNVITKNVTKVAPNEDDPGSFLNSGYFYDLKHHDRYVWLVCDEGLKLIDSKTYQIINVTNKELNIPCHSVNIDLQGTVWIGSANGLVKLSKRRKGIQKVGTFQYTGLDTINNVGLLAMDSKNNIFFAKGYELYMVDASTQRINRIKNNCNPDNFTTQGFCNFIEQANGEITITDHIYAYSFKRANMELVNKLTINGKNIRIGKGLITNIFEDVNKNLWYNGFMLNTISKDSNIINRCYPFGKDDFSRNVIFSSLELEPMKYLLGGAWNGLLYYDIGKCKIIEHFPLSTVINGSITVQNIFKDSKKEIWLATSNGLYYFDKKNKKYIVYNQKNGLNTNTISNIIEDTNGDLWVGTNLGVSKFNKVRKEFTNYDQHDGLLEEKHNTAAILNSVNNEIWYAGSKGIVAIDPNDLSQNTVKPAIVFTSFKYYTSHNINNIPFDYFDLQNNAKKIVLQHNVNIINIEFAAMNFINSNKNQYSYKLEGFNDDWVYLGTKHDVTFTNLDPGNYTLNIKGSNNDGYWNEEGSSIQFEIKPPWYKTLWANILFAFSTILSIGYYIRYRSIKLTKLNAFLEQKVEERTKELKITQEKLLKAEKMAILGEVSSELHDDIGSSLTKLNLKSFMLSNEIKDENFRQKLESIRAEISNMAINLKDIVWSINADRSGFDLATRIKEYINDISETNQIRIKLNVQDYKNATNNLKQNHNLYLITKEAINNALKYSQCTQIKISLLEDKLFIEDNGIGFDITSNQKGNGLKNMKARSEAIGWGLLIKSENGGGTLIKIFK